MGEGQLIDVSMLEARHRPPGLGDGRISPRARCRIPSVRRTAPALRISLHTADGYITVGATSPRPWTGVLSSTRPGASLGTTSASDECRSPSPLRGVAELIEAVTVTKPSEHWYRLLEEAGVPCGVLNRLDQVTTDEHVQARGFIRELDHTKLGKVRATGSPPVIQNPVRLERAGPILG